MVKDVEHFSPLGKSDHSIIAFKYIKEHKKMTKMLYNKGNYIGMKNEMGKINWSKAFKDCKQNIEEQYRIFLTELNKLEKITFQQDITVDLQRKTSMQHPSTKR